MGCLVSLSHLVLLGVCRVLNLESGLELCSDFSENLCTKNMTATKRYIFPRYPGNTRIGVLRCYGTNFSALLIRRHI